MRRMAVTLALVVASTRFVNGQMENVTTILEKKYSERAATLAHELEAAFLRDDIKASLLKPLQGAMDQLEIVTLAHDKAFHRKHVPSSSPKESTLKLVFVSQNPPYLKQDPNDLYDRYRSAVIIQAFVRGPNGEEIGKFPYEATVPVSANPEMEWRFPTETEAVNALAQETAKTAEGRLKMVRQFYDQIIEYKKLK